MYLLPPRQVRLNLRRKRVLGHDSYQNHLEYEVAFRSPPFDGVSVKGEWDLKRTHFTADVGLKQSLQTCNVTSPYALALSVSFSVIVSAMWGIATGTGMSL